MVDSNFPAEAETKAQLGRVLAAVDEHAWQGSIALVSALLSNASTQLSREDLQSRIRDTFATLMSLRYPVSDLQPNSPSVPTWIEIENSIGTDTLISFEDGRPYKNLKRHLHTQGLTPDQYREKWRLPADYPMIHPGYRAFRSQLAKAQGLGKKVRATEGRTVPTSQDDAMPGLPDVAPDVVSDRSLASVASTLGAARVGQSLDIATGPHGATRRPK